MPAFEYLAATADGRQIRGVLEGDSPRHARSQLRDRGLSPLEVNEVTRKRSERRSGISLTRAVSANQLAIVTRQLATLVRAALPLEEALQAASQQTESERLQGILLAVRARIMEGHTLADGLSDFPRAFPDIYRATVAAGEQSGKLDIVLERLADWTESRQVLQEQLRAAMYYPIILTTLTILVTAVLLAYVVPQVVAVFDNMDRDLPFLTVALIALSDFIRTWGIWVLVALGIGTIAFVRALKEKAFRWKMHALLLRLPLTARMVRGLNAARFARTFSILSSAGVPVLDGLNISAATVSNLPMRAAVEEAAVRVREGAPIARSLDASGLFPPLTIHLIASGESSGRLGEMLERASNAQEREMKASLDGMMALLGPGLILLMGAIVLVIVLAVLLPILDFNQMIR